MNKLDTFSIEKYNNRPIKILNIIQTLKHEINLLENNNKGLEKYLEVGEEGFFGNLLRGVFNTILHLFNNLKTNLFRSYRDLKRTELVYYHESYFMTISPILRADYNELKGLKVPKPKGMKSTYNEIITQALFVLSNIGMENRIKSLLQKVTNIKESILSSKEVDISSVNYLEDLPNIKIAFTKYNKLMNGSKVEYDYFINLFKDRDLQKVDEALLSSCDYQYGVSRVEKYLDNITSEFDVIIQKYQEDRNLLTKDDLLNLHKVTLSLAELFDIYGIVIQDITRIEHNFVIILKLIREELGY